MRRKKKRRVRKYRFPFLLLTSGILFFYLTGSWSLYTRPMKNVGKHLWKLLGIDLLSEWNPEWDLSDTDEEEDWKARIKRITELVKWRGAKVASAPVEKTAGEKTVIRESKEADNKADSEAAEKALRESAEKSEGAVVETGSEEGEEKAEGPAEEVSGSIAEIAEGTAAGEGTGIIAEKAEGTTVGEGTGNISEIAQGIFPGTFPGVRSVEAQEASSEGVYEGATAGNGEFSVEDTIPDPLAVGVYNQQNTFSETTHKSVPVYETVEDDYFEDALFIGDSRVVGLRDYGKLPDRAEFYAAEGLTIYKMLSAPIATLDGRQKVAVDEALTQKKFAKIYLMVGINELGIGTVEGFANKYREAVEYIRECQPDAIIYIQSIMNVTARRSKAGDYINNPAIEARNQAIRGIADNEHIFYLDVNESVCDENDALISEYTTDGVHLKARFIPLWREYLKQHAVFMMDETLAEERGYTEVAKYSTE